MSCDKHAPDGVPNSNISGCLWCALERQEAEIAELRAEVREWLCEKCNFVYPGPPQPGFNCIICPRCNGTTAPRLTVEKRKDTAKIERLRAALERIAKPPQAGAYPAIAQQFIEIARKALRGADETPVTLSPDGTEVGRWRQGWPDELAANLHRLPKHDPKAPRVCAVCSAPFTSAVGEIMRVSHEHGTQYFCAEHAG